MRRLLVTLCISFSTLISVPTTANAQTWSVSSLLNSTGSSPTIRLLKGSDEVDRVNRDSIQRVNDVSERVSNAYGLATPKLLIAKESSPNAFVTIGNDGLPVMVMNTEMLRLVGDDDDLMATVVGHEMGHLKADHLAKKKTTNAVFGLIGLLAGLAMDLNQAKNGVDTQGLGMQLGSVGAGLVTAKFSRDQEREADDLGIDRMARAGFNPSAAPRLWELMERQGGGGSGLWMSSHPSSSERYATLQASASTLNPVYLANRQTGLNQLATLTPSPGNTSSVAWKTAGENGFSLRQVDENSIRQVDGLLSYTVNFSYKSANVQGFQKTAVADCSGKRRFVVSDSTEWATRPFSDVIEGSLNAQELDLACQIAMQKQSTAATALASALRPVTSTDSTNEFQRDWRNVAENYQSLRQVDAKSIKRINDDLSYQVKFSYKPARVQGFEKTAVVDCVGKRRFEVSDQADWTSRPFNAVADGSLNAQEMAFVCQNAPQTQVAAGQSPPATNTSQSMPVAPATSASVFDGWQSIGEDVFSERYLRVDSVRTVPEGIAYLVRAISKGTTHVAYERTVVADCVEKTRFEVTSPSDWTARPFKSVYRGTSPAQEVETACQISAKNVAVVVPVPTATEPKPVVASLEATRAATGPVKGAFAAQGTQSQLNSGSVATRDLDASKVSGSDGATARKLRELNEMLKDGLITNREYQEKRKSLISAM